MELLHLVKFRLRFTRPTQFHFFHHAALYAALLDRLGTPDDFPAGVAIYCPERARVRYRAGEPYHFGVALQPGGPMDAATLKRLVASPPRTEYGRTDDAPFGDNYEVEDVEECGLRIGDEWRMPHGECATSGKVESRGSEAIAASPENGNRFPEAAIAIGLPRPSAFAGEREGQRPSSDLSAATARLAAAQEITIRFLSPLQILREPVETKQFLMDGEVFLPAKFLERVAQSVREWWAPAPFAAALPPPNRKGDRAEHSPCADVAELVENRLIRADLSYPKKRIFGAAGEVVLRFPQGVGAWAAPLLLAGAIGAGRQRRMGNGRYEILGHPLPAWPPRPAQTLLERAAHPDNLARARAALASAGPAAGVDGEPKDEFLDRLTMEMPTIASCLREGRVDPAPLRGVLLRSGDDRAGKEKLRPLAIPTLRDRFLQRAVLQELEPAVEQLLEDSSFAYRRGLSHRAAVKSVAEARQHGYSHVLRGDIRAFFDTVDWSLLRSRLTAYLGDDAVVTALMNWICAPIHFAGRTVERERGLPQGCVVSPLLANIYLDVFDEVLEAQGFRLVRFADDFAVLAKNEADLERARAIAAEELRELGLALNEEKTVAATFEAGFKFLGAVFCRSSVIEADPGGKPVATPLAEPPPGLTAASPAAGDGWLADYLTQAAADGASQGDAGEMRWRSPLPSPNPERRPIYVISRNAKLTGKKQGLLIEPEGAAPQLVAWNNIAELVVLGGHYVPSSVIQRAMRVRVPIAFHHWDGEPIGLVLPDRVRSPSPTALRQWEWSRDRAAMLAAAKELVVAKLRNTRLLVRRRQEDCPELMRELAQLENGAVAADSLDRLRGCEGQAAHAYFSQWPRLLKAPFGAYPGRITRGAEDPVNAMLNLLYTQLFRLAHTTALAVGLDPYLGVLHEGRGRYAALAADLMEPFRFLVDRTVLTAVNNGAVDPEDFARREKGPYRLLVGKNAMRTLLEGWEKSLARECRSQEGKNDSYRGHLHRQAMSLRGHIEEPKEPFAAFNMKW